MESDVMGWHFGYNCKHWVAMPGSKKGISPLGTGKCRVLIARYSGRSELLAVKPKLTTREMLAYTECSPQELIAQVERGEVQAKRLDKPEHPERDGYWRFRLRCSWDWDDSALSETGGQCFLFEPHGGAKVACIMDLWDLNEEHPDMRSDDEWRLVEDRLTTWHDEGGRLLGELPGMPS